MRLNELRAIVRQQLLEGRFEQLEQAFKSHPKDGSVFFHFSDLNKLGINPQSNFDTPLGIYGYPLDEHSWTDFVNKDLPFATERSFIHFFRAKNKDKILELDAMTMEEAFETWKKIVKSNNIEPQHLQHNDEHVGTTVDNIEVFEVLSDAARIMTPGGRLWYHMWREADDDIVRWNKMFRRAGIDGCVDRGKGIIHHAEPSQGVFFSLPAIELLSSHDNVDPEMISTQRSLKHIGEITDERQFYRAFMHLSFQERKAFLQKAGQRQLKWLSGIDDWMTRELVAKRIDPKHLPSMMPDEDENVRMEVAKRIDKSYLPRMMKDANPSVRMEVAKRIDQEHLPKMMKDPEWMVRFEVAERIDLTSLKRMLSDDDENVQNAAMVRLEKAGMLR